VRTWIASAFESGGVTDAVIVYAEDEAEAARLAALDLQDEWDSKGGDERVRNVFVVPFDDRVAYTTATAVARSEMQCCGGPAPDYVECDGHYATCPQRPEGTGQERSAAERALVDALSREDQP